LPPPGALRAPTSPNVVLALRAPRDGREVDSSQRGKGAGTRFSQGDWRMSAQHVVRKRKFTVWIQTVIRVLGRSDAVERRWLPGGPSPARSGSTT